MLMSLKHFSLYWLFFLAVTLASCRPVKFGPGTGYEIRGDKVYYSRFGGGYQYYAIGELIPEAEGRTFHIIDPFGYARDAHYVFYSGKVIANAEAPTFEILGCGYGRDHQHVYSYDKMLMGVQVASFKMIGGCFARDEQSVYVGGIVIENAHPDSFELLVPSGLDTGIYARDNERVYRWGVVMKNAQPDSFEVLGYTGCNHQGEYFTRDKHNAYYFGEVIPGADPETFQMLGECGYAKDTKRVYFEFRVVAGADLITFQVLDNARARDKNTCYLFGSVTSAEVCN